MFSALLTIAVLHWVVLLTPGANFLLVGQLAASGKRSTAGAAALGITTVTFTWATLAIMGIGIIFSAHPALRQFLQIAGGIYLCHLALKLWRSKDNGTVVRERELGHWAAFRLGFITNVLNPKTALFFGSIFATVLPAQPSVLMTAAAVALVYTNALVWHLFLALAFSHPQAQAVYTKHLRHFNRVAGAMVGAFGGKLIWSTLQELKTGAA